MNLIDQLDSENMNPAAAKLAIGDDVRVHVRIKDGDKVVTAGQNKIDQGSKVVIDNSIALKRQDTSTIQ